MGKQVFVVVSYDIPNDKRRLKAARLLLDFGGARVQRSVFECYLEARAVQRLQQRLRALHVAAEDSIRFYLLCENCRVRVEYIGTATAIEEPGLRII